MSQAPMGYRMRLLTTVLVLFCAGCNFFTSIDETDGGADGGTLSDSGDTGTVRDSASGDFGDDITAPVDMGTDTAGPTDTGPDAVMTGDMGMPDDMTNVDLGTDVMSPVDVGSDTSAPDMSAPDMPGAVCGDGVVEGNEQCEPGVSLGSSCFDQGMDGGQLACDPTTCTYDTSDCWVCDFYFAPETGDDGNAGTSPAQAWQSSGMLQTLVSGVSGASAGDTICIRRGEAMTVDVGIDVLRSGQSGAPIVFTHFGDPAEPLPLLTGSVPLPASDWTDLGGGIFSVPFAAAQIGHIWIGDQEYNDSASDSTLTDGNYFWDQTTLWLKPNSGALVDTVYVDTVGEVFDLGDDGVVDNIEFRGLRFRHGEHAIEIEGNSTAGASNISIRGCGFSHYDDGIRIYANDADLSSIRIVGNIFAVVGNGVYGSSATHHLITGVYAAENEIRSTVRASGSAIVLDNLVDSVIADNVLNAGTLVTPTSSTGIRINLFDGTAQASGNEIARNFVTGFSNGILLNAQPGEETQIFGNRIVNNVLYANGDQIQVEACDTTGGTTIEHNTIVETQDDAIEFLNDCGITVRNNLSAFSGGADNHVQADPRPMQAAVVPNSIDYNLYVPDTGMHWSEDNVDITFTEWQALGHDASGIAEPTSSFVSIVLQDPDDFIPDASFSAVDNGVDVGVTTDFAGRPRPQGNAVDIGAWERQPGDP